MTDGRKNAVLTAAFSLKFLVTIVARRRATKRLTGVDMNTMKRVFLRLFQTSGSWKTSWKFSKPTHFGVVTALNSVKL